MCHKPECYWNNHVNDNKPLLGCSNPDCGYSTVKCPLCSYTFVGAHGQVCETCVTEGVNICDICEDSASKMYVDTDGLNICFNCLQSNDKDKFTAALLTKNLKDQGTNLCKKCRTKKVQWHYQGGVMKQHIYCSDCCPKCISCDDPLSLLECVKADNQCSNCLTDIQNRVCTACHKSIEEDRYIDERGRCANCITDEEVYERARIQQKYAMVDECLCACSAYPVTNSGAICTQCPDKRICSHCSKRYYIPGESSLEMCSICYKDFMEKTASPSGGWQMD